MRYVSLLIVVLAASAMALGCAASKDSVRLKTSEKKLSACKEKLSACKEARDDLVETAGEEIINKDDALAAAELARRRLVAYRDIARRLRDAFGDDELPIIIRNGRLVLPLSNDLLYESGRAKVSAEGRKTLATVAALMKDLPKRRFLVAGHTDNVRVSKKTKRFKSNWELSAMRALRAVEHLASVGVPPASLAASAHGEHMPAASNDTSEGRARNRRTEIVVMPLIDEIPHFPPAPE